MKRCYFLLVWLICQLASAQIITPYPETILLKQINSAQKERARHCQNQPKYDGQPTGFYVEAGKKISVNVEIVVPGAGNAMPSLTIGTLGFNVGGRNTANGTGSNSPQNFALAAGANTITAPYGGLIYLSFLVNSSLEPTGEAQITFTAGSEHVRAPRYVYGVTSDAEFKEMLDAYTTPDVIFHSDDAIVAATRDMAIDYQVYNENKKNWMDQLHQLIETEDEISGMNNDDPNPVHHRLKAGEVRFLLTQNTNASPHASSLGYTGYPNNVTYGRRYLMMFGPGPSNSGANNSWLLGHELGHQHQQGAYLINQATESTVNIYSYVVERYNVNNGTYSAQNLPYNRTPATRWEQVQNTYLKLFPVTKRVYDMPDADLREITGFDNNELRFMVWEQLLLIFGDEFYQRLHRIVREEKEAEGGAADVRRAFLIWKATQITGYDLYDFFNLWGIRVTDENENYRLRSRIYTALERGEIEPLPKTAEEMVMTTGQNKPSWTPLPLKGIAESRPQNEGLDRSGWTVETSYIGVPDASFGGDNPYLIIDGSGGSQGFSFIKPGVSYGGVTGPSNYIMSFTIDMQAQKEFNYFMYSHRSSNAEARLRASEISVYGKNVETENFEPIVLRRTIATNTTDVKVSFDMVEYRYVKVVIENWDKQLGSTVQISNFHPGIEIQENLLPPQPRKYTVNLTTSEGIITENPDVFQVDEGEFELTFKLANGYSNVVVTVDGVLNKPEMSGGVYSLKSNIINNTNISISAESSTFSVKINRGEGITVVTPETGKVKYGGEFTAAFTMAANYVNPTASGGEAVIEGNTVRIPSVTSNLELTISATKLTGVNEFRKSQVKVYPNPVTSGQAITIEYQGSGLLKISAANGKLLEQKTISGGIEKITMNYPTGVYFFKIDAENEETIYKIVVQ